MFVKKQGLKTSEILKNEFDERSFVFHGAEGANWQITERLAAPKNIPKTKIEFVFTKD